VCFHAVKGASAFGDADGRLLSGGLLRTQAGALMFVVHVCKGVCGVCERARLCVCVCEGVCLHVLAHSMFGPHTHIGASSFQVWATATGLELNL
jgi:hypothetical protein